MLSKSSHCVFLNVSQCPTSHDVYVKPRLGWVYLDRPVPLWMKIRCLEISVSLLLVSVSEPACLAWHKIEKGPLYCFSIKRCSRVGRVTGENLSWGSAAIIFELFLGPCFLSLSDFIMSHLVIIRCTYKQFDYTELCIMFKACDRRNPGRSGATAIIIQPHHWSILKFTDASFYSHDSIIAPSDSSSQLYFQIFHAIWYSPKLSLQFCSVHRVTHSIGYYWYKARLKIIGICKQK